MCPYVFMTTAEHNRVNKSTSAASQIETSANPLIPESPIGEIFNQKMKPTNLKEKFLFATYEIVAEKGPEGLSASELIKRTDSSKGALFHHFKTLDELCLASLMHFKDYVKDVIRVQPCANLSTFLHAFAEDSRQRQCRVDYFHLSHFFRDRAMRDPRFRAVMNEASEAYNKIARDYLLTYLPTPYDVSKAGKVMRYFVMGLERVFYQSVVLGQPTLVDEQMPLLLQSVETFLNSK